MDPETEQAPGLMQQRWFGVPAPVIVVLGALVVYFLFFRNSSASGSGGASSSAGSGDTQTVGNTTIDTGAVQVTVNTDNGGGQPQPKPPVGTKTITVPNVVGKTLPQAQSTLKRKGLNPHADQPFEGKVVKQEKPRSGAKVKKGSTVDLIGQK